MNVRRLTVSAAAAGLTLLAAPAAIAAPTGSAGTGSSAIDTGSAATGSAGLSQTGSTGGAFNNCEDAKAAGRAPCSAGNRATDRTWIPTVTDSPARRSDHRRRQNTRCGPPGHTGCFFVCLGSTDPNRPSRVSGRS